VASYRHHYDSVMLDAGAPAATAAAAAAAGDDELEAVGLLRDDSHATHRLSFGSDKSLFCTCTIHLQCFDTIGWVA